MALGRKFNADGDVNPFDDAESYDGGSILARISRKFRRKKNKKHRKRVKHSRKSSHRRKKSVHRKSRGRVKFTKRGQPYIIDKRTGKAKFIKRSN
jgi:hypothetical protein